MNWKMTGMKVLQGCAEGALASLAAVTAMPGEKNFWNVLIGAVVVGLIRGGINAVKHLKKGA
jgi:ammonia channel protein AmtB